MSNPASIAHGARSISEAVDQIRKERDTYRRQRDELVEALESILDYEMAACKGIADSGVFPDGAVEDFGHAGATLRKIKQSVEQESTL